MKVSCFSDCFGMVRRVYLTSLTGSVLSLLFLNLTTHAAVELPSIIGNNMVLQSGEPLNFWGWADEGENVTIKQDSKVLGTAVGKGKETPWKITLPAQVQGPVADIEVTASNAITLTNLIAGEVWLCSGQSNMVMTLQKGPWCGYGGVLDADKVVSEAVDDSIRFYREDSGGSNTPQSRSKGHWVVCSPENAPEFSATAYFFARQLRSELRVPVGLVVSAVGGTAAEPWTSLHSLEGNAVYSELKQKAQALKEKFGKRFEEDQKALAAWKVLVKEVAAKKEVPPPKPETQLTPEENFAVSDSTPILLASTLYNGKIHPLAPFNIKGAIWYQGESNARRGDSYTAIMKQLISGWREDWGKQFPFVIVTLAGFGQAEAYTNTQGSYPLLREAQIKAGEVLPGVGVVSGVDVGNPTNIHPQNKQAVGQRAGLWALKHVYGLQLEARGPKFGEIVFDSKKAIVRFSAHAQGLTLKGPGGFELAGKDQKFVPATAELNGDSIHVSALGVEAPVALRYAFLNFPECTIYNGAGLPALPFRTDNWPVTPGVK